MTCVTCGKEPADNGSMKHPYCKGCFTEVWQDNYDWYFEWMGKYHGVAFTLSDREFVRRKLENLLKLGGGTNRPSKEEAQKAIEYFKAHIRLVNKIPFLAEEPARMANIMINVAQLYIDNENLF